MIDEGNPDRLHLQQRCAGADVKLSATGVGRVFITVPNSALKSVNMFGVTLSVVSAGEILSPLTGFPCLRLPSCPGFFSVPGNLPALPTLDWALPVGGGVTCRWSKSPLTASGD